MRTPTARAIALPLALAACVALGAVPAAAEEARPDPWERMNRGIFWFNDKLDVFILEPIATGWDFIAPDQVIQSVDNFIDNLNYPIDLANNLLQGKVEEAGTVTSRFLLNSTLGVGGLFDPATEMVGMEASVEDFGQTLGRWGVPAGPYLVLPLLGPSSVRDAVGRVADSGMRVWPYFVDNEVVWIYGGVEAVNTRTQLLDQVSTTKRTALDYYAAVRNGYLQYREAAVADQSEKSAETQDDLYYFEDEAEE